VSSKINKLKFYLDNNLNVLLEGKHGVGKTAMIKQVFESAGLVLGESYLYFSAATLDPWTDLIGVPKETLDPSGNRVLDFVRPRALSDSSKVQAIFFDEFNRAPKKIRNAVLELIQFKSINGKKFPNLKVVWAAINPYTEEEVYDVEKLDPPQRDRFEIFLPIPYECDVQYFKTKYGDDIGLAAVEWWNDLPVEFKDHISPRRLDYAINNHIIGGDLEDVIPRNSNISKLKSLLINGPVEKTLHELMNTGNLRKAKTFITAENNYEQAKKYIKANKKLCEFYLPLISNEKISLLMSETDGKLIKETIFDHIKMSRSVEDLKPDVTKKYDEMLGNIISASADKNLVREIGSMYESIARSKLSDVDSKTVCDWTQHCKISLNNSDNQKEFDAIKSGNLFVNAEQTLAFIHYFVNKTFTAKLKETCCGNFLRVYNELINQLQVDAVGKYTNDNVFNAKIAKVGLERFTDGTLRPNASFTMR
jgi:hypothetical protein